MKKHLVWTLLVIGINVSLFGLYYLYKTDSSLKNNQPLENESRPIAGTSEKNESNSLEEIKLWKQKGWRDEHGHIPRNAISEIIKQRDDYLEKQKKNDKPPKETVTMNQFSGEPLGVANTNWVSRGPQNVGGRATAIVVHPTDPNIIWTGTLGGGIWKSTDGGTTWFAMNGNLQNFTIGSMAIDPNNPDILYAGTDHGLPDGGIFKTINGGMTWTRLTGAAPGQGEPIENWSAVYRISIDPNNSNTILVATKGGLMRSTSAGVGNRASWTNVVPSADLSLDVVFDPTNSGKAIAAVTTTTVDPVTRVTTTYNRVVYSTNSGETWTNAMLGSSVLTANDQSIKLAYAKSQSGYVYAAYNKFNAQGGFVGINVAFSNNGGQSFTTKMVGGSSTVNNNGGFNSLWVSPADSNFILVGLRDVYKSTDGGDTFNQISGGYIMTAQPHVDIRFIANNPGFGTTNNIVYLATDGGVYRTSNIITANYPNDENISGGWERKDVGFVTSTYYSVAGNGGTGLILGGLQDSATILLLPGSQNANGYKLGGDGGFVAVDPMDDNYIYGEVNGPNMYRSTDRGNSFEDILNGNYPGLEAPFILDPNAPARMLAAGQTLQRTNNVKASGQPIWTTIRNQGTDFIKAVAVAPGHSNIIWVGQSDGRVYKTNNGLDTNPTQAWMPVGEPESASPLPYLRHVNRILIDKDNPNIVYVSYGAFTNGNLQGTTNGGITWTDLTGPGLPDAPIYAIARHPNNADILYVGTDIGIFRSNNRGASWNAVMDGPVNARVTDLGFMSNSTTLLAATFGRGIWSNDEGAVSPRRNLFDFDGDGHADVSVFRPSSNANFYLDRSLTGFQGVEWGTNGDKSVARDYDGDGKADIAVWRPSTGNWLRLNSSNGTFVSVQWGQQGDVPVPADYDGDGKTDQAVFRPSAGTWYLNRSMAGYTSVALGSSTDLPSAQDFDGDGKADQAVFRPSNGVWYSQQSTSGFKQVQFGTQGDIPAAADYDGDGKADEAVFRAVNGLGTWYVNRSAAGFLSFQWGLSTDTPVPADYDGDGKADIAVWRPTDGVWHLMQTTYGYKSVQFGNNSDIPIPAMP